MEGGQFNEVHPPLADRGVNCVNRPITPSRSGCLVLTPRRTLLAVVYSPCSEHATDTISLLSKIVYLSNGETPVNHLSHI